MSCRVGVWRASAGRRCVVARRRGPRASRPTPRSWSIVDPRGYTSDHDPGVRTPVAASPSLSGAKSVLGHQFRSSVRLYGGFGLADEPTWSIDHSPLWANFHLTKMAGDDGGDDVLDSGILASVWCGRTATAWLRGCQSASTDEGLRRSPGSRSRVTPGRLHDAASDRPAKLNVDAGRIRQLNNLARRCPPPQPRLSIDDQSRQAGSPRPQKPIRRRAPKPSRDTSWRELNEAYNALDESEPIMALAFSECKACSAYDSTLREWNRLSNYRYVGRLVTANCDHDLGISEWTQCKVLVVLDSTRKRKSAQMRTTRW